MEFAAQLVLVRQEADDRAESSSGRMAGHGWGQPPPAALVAKLPMLPSEG